MEFVTNGMECVTNGMEFVTNGMECVTNGMECVTNGMECVTDDMECVTNGMECVTNGMECVTNGMEFMMNDSDSSRSSYPNPNRIRISTFLQQAHSQYLLDLRMHANQAFNGVCVLFNMFVLLSNYIFHHIHFIS